MRTTWDELLELSDQNLDALFHQEPTLDPTEQEKELYAFFPHAETRLKHPGFTLRKLFEEYFV